MINLGQKVASHTVYLSLCNKINTYIQKERTVFIAANITINVSIKKIQKLQRKKIINKTTK